MYSTLELLEGARARPARRHGQRRGGVRLAGRAARATRSAGAAARWPTSTGTAAPADALSRAAAAGFVPDHAQLVVWGRCPACAAAAAAVKLAVRRLAPAARPAAHSPDVKQFSSQHLAALAALVARHRRQRVGSAPPSRAVDEMHSRSASRPVHLRRVGRRVRGRRRRRDLERRSTAFPLQLTDAVSAGVDPGPATRRQLLVELAYFWTFTASLQAVITPDLGQAFPSVFYFTYFTYHVGAIVAAAYLVFGCRLYPRHGAAWRVFWLTLAWAAVAGAADLVTGGNYMYLRYKPVHASLLSVMSPLALVHRRVHRAGAGHAAGGGRRSPAPWGCSRPRGDLGASLRNPAREPTLRHRRRRFASVSGRRCARSCSSETAVPRSSSSRTAGADAGRGRGADRRRGDRHQLPRRVRAPGRRLRLPAAGDHRRGGRRQDPRHGRAGGVGGACRAATPSRSPRRAASSSRCPTASPPRWRPQRCCRA